MATDIKLQNIVLQMEQNANFLFYPALIAKGKISKTSPFIYDPMKHCHILKCYDDADFMTYFNCLPIKRWKKYTNVNSFALRFKIKGKFAVEIYEIYSNSQNVNLNRILNSAYSAEEISEINIPLPETSQALVGFRLTALSDVELYEGCYMGSVEESDIRDIRLSLVTTTFKKQEYIKNNIAMLKEKVICDGSDLKGSIFIHIIDNERALAPESYDCSDLKIYHNPNTGGSGGFTRGMIEALDMPQKPTHILLMDDDVMILPESLFRTFYLLRILKDEYKSCFLSGAMFDYDIRERQYEDIGYVHKADGSYGPLKSKLDMEKLENIYLNDLLSEKEEENSYAGWWYCCIPISHIEKNGLPLPLFVRGDDVEFALRNSPGFITMNGICIWHVGFAGKFNAAMELYQVHRNSLIIQAASGICSDIDFMHRIKRQFWKEITRFAYGNAELLLDSIDDFMKGPQWLKALDGELSLKEHNAKNEKMIPLSRYTDYPGLANKDPYEYTRLSLWSKAWYVLTINGHLLPGFMLRNYPSVIACDWFFVPGKNFRRKHLMAVNPNSQTGCLRTISRKKCFALMKRYRKTMKNYKKNHIKTEQAYKEQFGEMTSPEFWKGYLGI